MTNQIPTVRVVNPHNPKEYIIINYSDMKPHHELWPEQSDNFDAATAKPRNVATEYSEDELRASVRMISKIMTLKLQITMDAWHGMQPRERMALLTSGEAELDDGVKQMNAAREERDREIAEEARVAASQTSTTSPPVLEPLSIGKGPQGKLYLKRGEELFSGPYKNSGEAEAALRAEMKK